MVKFRGKSALPAARVELAKHTRALTWLPGKHGLTFHLTGKLSPYDRVEKSAKKLRMAIGLYGAKTITASDLKAARDTACEQRQIALEHAKEWLDKSSP